MAKSPSSQTQTQTHNRESLQIENAEIDWCDGQHPKSVKFDDIYHSSVGACDESEHVFLQGTNLLQRWQALAKDRLSYTVAEIGFGSGLNFLMTWKKWQNTKNKPRQLHYIGFEKYPLKTGDMRQLLAKIPSLEPFSARLLKQYCDHSKICHRIRLAPDIILDLHFGDAVSELQGLDTSSGLGVDSWYLDGFSPKLNPLMWQQELIDLIAQRSSPSATLATYSAAGFVRRQLSQAGFDVNKVAGFGTKRHMTVASFNPLSSCITDQESSVQPWYKQPPADPIVNPAIVIGAGIAGCFAAYSLAQRGFDVVVLEAGERIASGASGIPQLALRPRLFKNNSPLAQFYLQGFIHSFTSLRALSKGKPYWHPSGVIQMATALNKKNTVSNEDYQAFYGAEIAQQLTPAKIQELTELETLEEALLFAKGGWLDPHALCASLLQHEKIQLLCNYSASSIERTSFGSNPEEQHWLVRPQSAHQATVKGSVVVLANGHEASTIAQTSTLPLQTVRGQVTQIAVSEEHTAHLNKVLCGQRSIFPAHAAVTTVSATYRHGRDKSLRNSDDHSNLASLAEEFPQLSSIEKVASSVGIRCNTPDFFPIIGMAPDLAAMESVYGDLRRDAGKQFEKTGVYHKGLYLSLAHGSNGLATAPLAGETLASMICAEPSPLSQDALAGLSATRFLIRDLKKQR